MMGGDPNTANHQVDIPQLRLQLASDPFNSIVWDELINATSNAYPDGPERVSAMREAYESVTLQFPTSTSYFREFCEFEINSGTPETVKALFGRCLLVCLDVDLYGLYVDYIKSASQDDQAQIRACLEFALEHVGWDCRSGGLWEEYLELLVKAQDGKDVANVRQAFHRALVVPSNSLDHIWGMYEAFENSTSNKALAKRALDEWRTTYHACKAVSNARLELNDQLDTKMLPLPPGKGGRYQMEQAEKWRRYCRFERDNQVGEDGFRHAERVGLAYEQSLSYLVQFPDVWLDYAEWKRDGEGGVGGALKVLERGCEALPSALALHFMAADLMEEAGDVEKARAVYEALVVAGEERKKDEGKNEGDEGDEGDDDGEAEANRLKTLAWIVYMRFTKRVDGVQKSRLLFMRARKFTGLQWEAYAAAARFEWLNDGNKDVACKIYELGLKTFLNTPPYVVEYAKFLIGVGDFGNARSLFERALTETADEETGPLWDAFIAFEAECGGFSTVASLQIRRREALREASTDDPLDAMQTALLRYKFLDLYPGHVDQFEVSPELFEDADNVADGDEDGANADADYDPAGGPGGGPGGHAEELYSPGGPGGRRGPGPGPGRRPMVPRELHGLAMLLQRGEVEGPIPEVDYVLGPVMSFDFTPAGISRHEAALGIGGDDRGGGGPRKRGRRM